MDKRDFSEFDGIVKAAQVFVYDASLTPNQKKDGVVSVFEVALLKQPRVWGLVWKYAETLANMGFLEAGRSVVIENISRWRSVNGPDYLPGAEIDETDIKVPGTFDDSIEELVQALCTEWLTLEIESGSSLEQIRSIEQLGTVPSSQSINVSLSHVLDAPLWGPVDLEQVPRLISANFTVPLKTSVVSYQRQKAAENELLVQEREKLKEARERERGAAVGRDLTSDIKRQEEQQRAQVTSDDQQHHHPHVDDDDEFDVHVPAGGAMGLSDEQLAKFEELGLVGGATGVMMSAMGLESAKTGEGNGTGLDSAQKKAAAASASTRAPISRPDVSRLFEFRLGIQDVENAFDAAEVRKVEMQNIENVDQPNYDPHANMRDLKNPNATSHWASRPMTLQFLTKPPVSPAVDDARTTLETILLMLPQGDMRTRLPSKGGEAWSHALAERTLRLLAQTRLPPGMFDDEAVD